MVTAKCRHGTFTSLSLALVVSGSLLAISKKSRTFASPLYHRKSYIANGTIITCQNSKIKPCF